MSPFLGSAPWTRLYKAYTATMLQVQGSITINYAIFCKLYSVKQLLYIVDFSKEVFSGFYLFNKVLAEELCL